MNRIVWLLPAVAILALLLTWMLKRYALSRSLIDIPNARSSHSLPTPRGGGVAVVISFLIALLVLWAANDVSSSVLWALLGSGAAIAVIGFLDDHGHIAARWRLLGHFSAAFWALYWLGGIPEITFFTAPVNFGWLGIILGAFYIVWMLNLYNFMDGIDGLASVEALCVCLGACVIYIALGYIELIWLPLALCMAVLGFLYWNFPPARIFMGDAGSGFLGITLAVLSLQAAWHDTKFFWVWIILLGVFIVDASFTLIRRLFSGCKVYEAHRSHAYQYASRQMGKHLPVTLAVLAINMFWLLPIAIGVALLEINGLAGVVIAYIPLVLLAIKFHAGEKE
nr:glycosyltransferase family 4 protein [uncultured Pseudomonas sp.]